MISRRLKPHELNVVASEVNPYTFTKQLIDGTRFTTKQYFSVGIPVRNSTPLPALTEVNTDMNIGWWSAHRSDSSGNFTNPPEITLTFAETNVNVLFIEGDIIAGVYPTRLKVDYIEKTGSVIKSETINNPDKVLLAHNVNLSHTITKVVIKILSVNYPETFARLRAINVGVRDVRALMNAPGRAVKGKVEITYLKPFEPEATRTPYSNDTHPSTRLDQIVDEVDEPTYHWFDVGNNNLGGNYHPIGTPSEMQASQYQVGWWSRQLAAADGSFAVPPKVGIRFTRRLALACLLTGDALSGNYPVDFNIHFKLNGVEVFKQEIRGNNDVYWVGATNQPNLYADDIELEILKISRPNSHARIIEFNTTVREIYTHDDALIMMDLLEELHYEDTKLPIGTLSSNEIDIILLNKNNKFDVRNTKSPISQELKKNRRVRAWLGIEEIKGKIKWFPLGTFYTVQWNLKTQQNAVTIKARDRLELLKGFTLESSIMQNKTFYELFEFVCNRAGLTTAEYQIDDMLKNTIVPYTWFDTMNCKEALRRVALNCLANVYVDRNNVVRIEDTHPTPKSQFDFTNDSNIIERSYPLAWMNQFNTINVKYNTFAKASSRETILDYKETITVPAGGEVQKYFKYTQGPIFDDIVVSTESTPSVNAQIIAANAYGCLLKFPHPGTNGDVSLTRVTASGYKLEAQASSQVSVKDQDQIDDAGVITAVDEFDGDFIQDANYAGYLAKSLLDRFNLTQYDIDMMTRGHIYLPLGSRLTIEDDKGVLTEDYTLIRQTLKYDGGLSADVIARKIK